MNILAKIIFVEGLVPVFVPQVFSRIVNWHAKSPSGIDRDQDLFPAPPSQKRRFWVSWAIFRKGGQGKMKLFFYRIIILSFQRVTFCHEYNTPPTHPPNLCLPNFSSTEREGVYILYSFCVGWSNWIRNTEHSCVLFLEWACERRNVIRARDLIIRSPLFLTKWPNK